MKLVNNARIGILRNDAKLLALPVGGMMFLRNAPMFSDKIMAIKQDNDTVLFITSSVSSNVCIVEQAMHFFSFSDWIVYSFMTSDVAHMNASVLLDYTSYNQHEWRYIRHLIGQAASHAGLVSYDVSDATMQSMDSHTLKPLFLMSISFWYENISFFSVLNNVLLVAQMLIRSRATADFSEISTNVDSVDMDELSTFANCVDNVEWDDDAEYKEYCMAADAGYLSLESQLSIAGLCFDYHMHSSNNMYMLFNFCYINLYNQIIDFFYFFFVKYVCIFLCMFITTYAKILLSMNVCQLGMLRIGVFSYSIVSCYF